MPDDYGHDWTDEELEKLEKRIARVYRQASKDMQKNIEDYFARFVERDQKMRSLIGTIQNGKEWTEEDYKQWRLNQFGRGKRFQQLRDQLAERATKANEVANAYINDLTPSVYSLNRNYAAYTIERVSGNVGFTLWDESTVRRLLVKRPDLMPYYPLERAIKRGIDLAWGKKQITNTITSAILRGLSIKGISEELRTRVPEMGLSSSIRAARTAITSAENAGRMDSYKAASDMGIKVRKRWVATKDGRTRHAHRRLDGQTVDWDESFSSELGKIRYPGDPRAKPANVYNCFAGDVKVASDSKLIRSYKHIYEGDLITVKTAGGVKFTCTPNHPILTPSGWVPAKLLNNGNDILVAVVGKNNSLGVNPDINHAFPSFDAIHKFLDKMGGQRACGVSVNFHGDVATSNVEIITQKRLLRNNRNPSIRKRINKFLLKLSDKPLVCKSALMEHFWSVCKSPFGLICSKGKALSFLGRRLSHSNVHGFRPSTDMNVVLPEYSIDNSPAETMLKRELIDRLPGKVFLDHVVSIEVSSSNCHVYNLQTESGYYFVNSSIPQDAEMCNGIFAIAKNCRCTLRTVEKPGIEAETRKMRVKDPKTGRNIVVNEMTYGEWERWVKSRA